MVMTDQEKREKVIAELERVADEANPWKESPPLRCDISYPLLIDALTLLKVQKSVEPKRVNRYIDFDGDGHPYTPETYDCGVCGNELPWKANYCPVCGRAVKWK